MAATEGPARAQDRHGRRHPFSNWMKRLANLKSPSDAHHSNSSSKTPISKNKKSANSGAKNNPYPLSGNVNGGDATGGHLSFSEPATSERRGRHTPPYYQDGEFEQPPATGTKSNAPTLSTNGETTVSDAAHSKAGTSATAGGGISSSGGGEGSTFSSPAPSERSLTTTLTTIQSAAPSNHLNAAQNVAHVHPAQPGSNQTVQFSHQFPDSPATAVPSHLAPGGGHPTTYNTATANNLLTDNASILTLASSSKRRRRNSLDTNASVRALAPSSVFGGSRESLPLSLLSANVEPSNASTTNASGALNRPGLGGLASSERISVYSSSGVVASGSGTHAGGDRGSFHASRPGGVSGGGDSGSVRSGLHGRNDSYAGSTGGGVSSPLNSPAPGTISTSGRVSRRGSGWGEVHGDDEDDEKGKISDGEKELEKEADEKVEREETIDHQKPNES
ncbi:hypothetical protein FQN54_007267 [Arachnomyces sp. PD_36]|nr:hypothetical protein FQN54_007267 [Arachnomyces sp. PD_36]